MRLCQVFRIGRIMIVIAHKNAAIEGREIVSHCFFALCVAAETEIDKINACMLCNQRLITVICTARTPSLRNGRTVVQDGSDFFIFFSLCDPVSFMECKRERGNLII